MTATIDVQGHYMPLVQREAIARYAAHDPVFAALTGVLLTLEPVSKVRRLDEDRISEMDRAGVDVQVISLPPPGAAFGDAKQSGHLASEDNDALVEAAGSLQPRFMVLGSLPLPHLPEAFAELERLAQAPLVRGVLIDATSADWTIDEPRFEELWGRLAGAGLPLFLHPPLELLPPVYAEWRLGHSVGTMVSTTLAALRLVFSGVLDRVPGLEVIVPLLGGTLPYLERRIADLSGRGAAQHDLIHYLSARLYYDSCSHHRPALRCAIETVGVERIMLGSDYPFRGELGTCVSDIIGAGLARREQEMILGRTASRWFAP